MRPAPQSATLFLFLHSYPRHPMAAPFPGACGHGCAPVPKPIGRRGLSERSEFRSPSNRDWGKGTRRATPGRPWFWVLLPKQKGLGVRGRNPARPSPLAVRGRTPARPSPPRRAVPSPRDAPTTLRNSSASLRAGSVRDLRWPGGRADESPRRRGEARRWPGVDTSAPPRRSAVRSAQAGPTPGFAP